MNIVITKMYRGRYLEESIGHEVINTFKADNGKHYIYVSPYGKVDKRYQNVDVVLLTRTVFANKLEVIGYASGLKCCIPSVIYDKRKNGEDFSVALAEQKKKIQEEQIKYGGVFLNEIFDDSSCSPKALFITYEAKEYHAVRKDKRIYIFDQNVKGDDSYRLPDKRFALSSLHMYLNENNSESIKVIKDMINNSELWEKDDTCQKIDVQKKFETTLIDVIGQSYKELVFSNWLAYYLCNDRNFLKSFLQKVLGFDDIDENNSVKREYKNIDLFIETAKEIIVIENKLRSGINGRYIEREGEIGYVVKTQLDKYVTVANDEKKKKRKENECLFFILLPNYKFVGENEIACSEGKYKVIRYSALCEFCKKYKGDELPYYGDFGKALEQHSTEYLEDLFPLMEKRFIEKIKKNNL